MNYGDILRNAFSIARRNRYLWFFGFFAGGSFSFNFNFPFGDSGDGGAGEIGTELADHIGLIIGLLVAFLLLLLIFIVLSVISQGALAESVAAIDRGESRRFGMAWRAGLSTFWRVVGEGLLLFLIALGLFLAIAVPATLLIVGTLAATDSTVARVVIIGLVALVGVVAFFASFFAYYVVAQLTLRHLMLRGASVVEAYRAGYRLVRARPGPTLLLGLLAFAMSIAAALVLVLAILLVGIVLFLPAIVLVIAGYTTAAIVAAVVAGVILLAALLPASGAIGTFNHALWTLGYLRLTNTPAAAVAAPAVPPPGG